jgi:hypothetical protein
MKSPADFPYRPPETQILPVASQKACGGRIISLLFAHRRGKKSYLPLCRKVAITSGDTKEECIKVCEFLRGNHCVVVLGRSMHFGKDFLRESLGNSIATSQSLVASS